MLLEKINQDLISSQKSKDDLAINCLRMLKSAFKYAAIQKLKDSLDEPEIIDCIQKQIKQRKDSVDAYRKAAREDLATKEEREIEVLAVYLPKGLSDEELSKVVDEVIQKTGAKSKADMGKVIKEVMTQTRGRADGSKISQLVSQRLV